MKNIYVLEADLWRLIATKVGVGLNFVGISRRELFSEKMGKERGGVIDIFVVMTAELCFGLRTNNSMKNFPASGVEH